MEYRKEPINTSFISYDLRIKQWDTEKIVRKELNNPDFYSKHTRKSMREILTNLFPYETLMNPAGRAFMGMTKKRMLRHLYSYALVKGWTDIKITFV